MNAERPFPSELWEQISVAVQDYIDALEARVTALEAAVQCLEATVQHLTERLQQDSRTSLPAPVERSASGDHETASSRPQWPAARRAARPRGAGTGAGAG